jgi:ATP-binding cassette subfamily B protein
VIYREIKQSLTDLEKMFSLMEREREIADVPGAEALKLSGDTPLAFENVSFAYDPGTPGKPGSGRAILHNISFTVPAGKTVAVVGPSGAGKSTLARLLFRFYDVSNPLEGGRILIAGQDIKQVTQASVRQAIGIVPQDTVLFNDTVEYNIAYGRPGAERPEVERPPRRPTSTTLLHPPPRAMPRWSGSADSSSRVARSSAWPSPERC